MPISQKEIDALASQLGGTSTPDGDVISQDEINLLTKQLGATSTPAAVPTPVASPVIENKPPVPATTPEQIQAEKQAAQYSIDQPEARSVTRLFKDAGKRLTKLPVDVGNAIATDFQSGRETISQGFTDIGQGRPATGVGNIGLGALGVVASPLTGTTKELVEKPVTQLTGNPEIGERAGIVAGSAIPVNKLGSAINAARPSKKAVSLVIDAIGDGNKLAEGITRLKENPRLSIADVFPSVLQDTQKLAVTEGKHQTKLADWSENRTKGSKGVVESIYDNTMGAPVNVLEKVNEMKEAARKTGREKINPVVDKAGPVDVSNIVAHIDAQLKPGIMSVVSEGRPLALSSEAKQQMKEVRKLLTDNKSFRTSAKELHEIQSSLRAEADNLLHSADGQSRRTGHAMMDLRNRIVDAIDKSSGPIDPDTKIGPYKSGLSKYRDDKDIQTAFDKGTLVTKNRPGQWDDRPEYWKEWVDKASDGELKAAREGARIAVDQQIKGMRFAAKKGTDIPEIEFNRDKLSLLFGKKEVETMAKQLADERAISITNQKLFHDSQTAFRLKSNDRIDLPEKKKTNPLGYAVGAIGEIAGTVSGYPGIGLTLMAGNAARDISHFAKTKLARKTNEEYTNLVTSTGEARDELIRQLQSYLPQPKPSLLQRAGTTASRLPIAP